MTYGLLGSLEIRVQPPDSNAFYNKFAEALRRHADWHGDVLARVTQGLWTAENMQVLKSVNARVNAAAPYKSDARAFGFADRWAAPHEFFDSGGDCEDFAIAKYLALESLGLSTTRLVVAEDGEFTHALLAVWLDGKVWLLDNRQDAFTSHEHQLKYRPVFSYDRSKAWVHIVTPEIRADFVGRHAGA